MKQRIKLTVLIMIICLAVSACCQTCREQPIYSGPDIYEIPEPFQLRYKYWPTQYLQDFAVIQGGQEYILTPDGDGTWSLQ